MQPSTPWFDVNINLSSVASQNAPQNAPLESPESEVIVVGAGVAGCSVAWCLYQAGWRVTLIDMASTLASRASGNRRAVLKPHLSRNAASINVFYEQAFELTSHRLSWLESRGFRIEKDQLGALQLFKRAGDWPSTPLAKPVNERTASELSQIPLRSPALFFPQGGWINSASFCTALLNSCKNIKLITNTKITGLHRKRYKWLLTACSDKKNSDIDHPKYKRYPHNLETHNVILAAGSLMTELITQAAADLPLGLINSTGQTTLCRYKADALRPKMVISAKRYVVPEAEHCTVGATHWRNQSDLTPVIGDDIKNLSALTHINEKLGEGLALADRWREVRSSTIDRLPLVGPVPDTRFYKNAYQNIKHGPKHQTFESAQYVPGLYVLGGLGSRGMSSATICAEILCGMMTGSELPHRCITHTLPDFYPLVHPARFLMRQLKQGHIAD